MLKQLLTLARGRSEDATAAFLDANALSLLRQQLRDAATSVEASRKALAVVIAYAEREKASLRALTGQIETLEGRALVALEKKREDLALEASEAIADLEAEAGATRKAIDTYASEIRHLRQALKHSEAQLTDLKRGQRLAEASDKALKLRGAMPALERTDLEDAAATLRTLQSRQHHAAATARAMADLSTQIKAETLEDRLAAAGCGAPKPDDAAAVLARLKAAQNAQSA